jgi:hypothetical protein
MSFCRFWWHLVVMNGYRFKSWKKKCNITDIHVKCETLKNQIKKNFHTLLLLMLKMKIALKRDTHVGSEFRILWSISTLTGGIHFVVFKYKFFDSLLYSSSNSLLTLDEWNVDDIVILFKVLCNATTQLSSLWWI